MNIPEDANRLQLAIRSRIKLFFRPVRLPGTANEAPGQVLWSFVKKPNGKYALAAQNPTAYHVTFSRVHVRTGGNDYTNEEGAMVAPYSMVELDIGHVMVIDKEIPAQVQYTTVNDYGAAVSGEFHAAQP